MGTDPNGYKRFELGWSLPDVYLYLTPKSSIQVFTVLGFDMRVEHFEAGSSALSDQVGWGQFYMGAILGGGFESRLNKSTALRFELRGFVRGRVDDPDTEANLRAVDPVFASATRSQKGLVLSAGMVVF